MAEARRVPYPVPLSEADVTQVISTLLVGVTHYGTLTIYYEAGTPTRMEIKESVQLRGGPRLGPLE